MAGVNDGAIISFLRGQVIGIHFHGFEMAIIRPLWGGGTPRNKRQCQEKANELVKNRETCVRLNNLTVRPDIQLRRDSDYHEGLVTSVGGQVTDVQVGEKWVVRRPTGAPAPTDDNGNHVYHEMNVISRV